MVPSHPGDSPSPDRVEAPRRCLVLVAHPDDEGFGCSGTTSKWASAGTEVDLVVATDGSKGSHDLAVPAEEVALTRQREQRAAAEILGYRGVHFLGRPDGELVAETVLRPAVELIRALRPEVVIGHDPWRHYQLHPDHRAAGEVVRDAVWRAGEPRLDRGAAWKPRELWLFHAQEPNHVEDVSDWIELKWQALMCHASQYRSAFGFEPDDDAARGRFRDWFLRRFAAAGEAEGFRYGESFRRIVL